MSNSFWAVFFGSALGLFSVNIIMATVEEFRAKRRSKSVHLLLDRIEELDFEDYDD